MPSHDIIDNCTEKLIDHLSEMLGTSERVWIDRMVYKPSGLMGRRLWL